MIGDVNGDGNSATQSDEYDTPFAFVWRENGGLQWAPCVAPTILLCQRHGWVLDPRNPVRRPAVRGARSGDQNPLVCDRRLINSLCGATISNTIPSSPTITASPTTRIDVSSDVRTWTYNNTLWLRCVHQQNGGLLGVGEAVCNAPSAVIYFDDGLSPATIDGMGAPNGVGHGTEPT